MAAEKASSGVKKKDERIRNYASVVYPDSAPENWLDILKEKKVPIFVSPLHDKDINADGSPKKPHFHVMWLNEGKKSDDQAREFFAAVNAVGLEKVISLRGYARYLCHLDNPEKAQYSISDVVSLGGADYYGAISLVTDKYKAISEMKDFCERYDIVSFYLLDRYAQNYRSDWARVLADNSTLHMKEWLQSRKWSRDNHYMQIFDPETGEVVFDFGSSYENVKE